MSPPLLKLEEISKQFGKIIALRSINLEVTSNELVVILGPTGAGKTTLLRTIAGLEQPNKGKVWIGDRDVTMLPPSKRDIALVFQNFSLYPRQTVRQNLEFPLKAPGNKLSKREINHRITWAASILNISPLLNRPSTLLSGGEMQRVAIGRAIVRQPQLFLLDEPLTNLDAKLRESLRFKLIALRRELQTPMLYVTHDQTEALSMADRIVVLSEGEILQIDTPEKIYEKPTSPKVARQLGNPPINLIDVEQVNSNWTARDGTPLMPTNLITEKKHVIGIRPENITPYGGNSPAIIRMVENLGPSTILLFEWAGSEIHLVITGEKRFKPGEKIFPKFDPSKTILWPKTPGLQTQKYEP